MQADDLKTASFQSVHFRPAAEIPSLQEIKSSGLKAFELDSASIASTEALLNSIAHAMSFPSYFRKNWNALDECLSDLSWAPANGYVLLVQNAKHLWQQIPEDAGLLVECWLNAAEIWAGEDIPFHLIFIL